MERTMKMYDNKIYGVEVSEYGLEKGYLDYLTLSNDEIVFYNEELDLYLWGIAHFGTAWSYVLTNVRLIGEDDPND